MIRTMEAPKGIHFQSSYLQWVTYEEVSHGCFQIDAVLDWYAPGHKKAMSFVLAAAVPAGRMYATSGPLLKQPPYSFQLIAGHVEHTIQRRALDHSQLNIPTDNTQLNNDNFKFLNWNLNSCQAKPLQPESLAAIPQPPPMMNIAIVLKHNEGLWRLQAPLRHWNHRCNPPSWQIETGPVLWPLDIETFKTEASTRWLTPAWIHANDSNRVTISGDRLPCHEQEAELSILVLD